MKTIEIWLVLHSFLCLSGVLANTFQVSTEGCGTSKTCRYFPDSCNPSDNTCRIITWRQAAVSSGADTAKIVIEMRSSASVGYFAMGFGRYATMQDADVYYCTSANTFATAAIIVQHDDPTPGSLANGVKQISSSVKDGAIHCEYERTMSVTKPSTTGNYDYDISREMFHILVAEGATTGANHALTHHSSRQATPDKINFTANFVVPATPTAVPASSNTTSNKTDPPPPTVTPPITVQTTSAKANAQTTSGAESSESSIWLGCAILIISMLLSNWNS